MKTWISNHQVLATIIILAIVAGILYLIYYLVNKNSKPEPIINPNDNVPVINADVETNVVTGGRGRMAGPSHSMSVSSVGTAAAGMRTSSNSVKH